MKVLKFEKFITNEGLLNNPWFRDEMDKAYNSNDSNDSNDKNNKKEEKPTKDINKASQFIDEDGNYDLTRLKIEKLPDWCKDKVIKGDFYCNNNNLKTLENSPKEVIGDFFCYNNQLTTLEDAPKIVGGTFNCTNNKTQFTENDVRKVCDVKGKIIVKYEK